MTAPKPKALMKTVLCRERLPHQYPPDAVQGLILGNSMDLAYDILKGTDGKQYFILDGNYEHFYFLTNDSTTASDGTATTVPLYLGKFELREEQAPYGMVLLKEPVQTELTYAGEHVKITTVSETAINERQKVVISLLKKLETDEKYSIGLGEEYKNIQFGLYAAEALTAADGMQIPKD